MLLAIACIVIDLGNGLKTNAQLTYPAVGKAPAGMLVLFIWMMGREERK